MTDYNGGSEWRKWDLHVHSPYSSGYKGTWDQFVNQVKAAECDVIGINDYFSVAGYKQLINEISQGTVDLGSKVLFPVVEMRMTDTVQNKATKTNGVTHFNFHLIFNNDQEKLNISDIELFLRSLESNNTMIGSDYDDKEKLQSKKVSFNQVLEKLDKDDKFLGNYLVWLPYDEYGGIDQIDPQSDGWIKGNFIKKCNILGSSRQEQIDFFHWKSPLKASGEPRFSQEEFESWFERKKPCIKGSDSHHFTYPIGRLKNENSEPIEKFCWIKADPTFPGLKQLINEPEDRIYIGQIPELLVRASTNPTRIIKRVNVKKRNDAKTDENWFDFDLPVNSGLVAIIGNKGSGKSALADILGLLGNTKRFEKFSFLTPKKFGAARGGKARHFRGSLTWGDEKLDVVETLEAFYNNNKQERIKYIPQQYLEDICSEVGLTEDSAFYSELKEVIFSRISHADRLDFDNLDSLLKHRDKEIESRIDQLINDIKSVNRDIVEIEAKLSEEHKQELRAKLNSVINDIDAHNSEVVKPHPVEKPNEELDEKAKSLHNELEQRKLEYEVILEKLKSELDLDAELAKKEAGIEKLEKVIDNIKQYVSNSFISVSAESELIGIDPSSLVELKFNTKALDVARDSIKESRAKIALLTSPENPNGLPKEISGLNEKILDLSNSLSEPQRKYQEYLENMTMWSDKLDVLVGNETSVGTKKYYENEIRKVDESYPLVIKKLKRQRLKASLKIFKEKLQLRAHYAKYYGSVQQYLDAYPIDSVKNFRIKFDVSIAQSGFIDQFIARINQAKSGSFYGANEGLARISEIINRRNFDSIWDLARFFKDLLKSLENYNGKEMRIKDQLKKGESIVEEFYNFIFSLDYLRPIYNLKWDDKELSQLSPGERGNLLLIFYLVLDRNDIPLIIDQPEENLDNQTVFNTLVPCIKDAKKRRQIILVTHNPNLAVVCDADQIIHAKMYKSDGNRVIYTSGAIENPGINKKIVDVLEGTRPAFDSRDAKYLKTKITN